MTEFLKFTLNFSKITLNFSKITLNFIEIHSEISVNFTECERKI